MSGEEESTGDISEKGYQEALWCIKKHLMLAKTHTEETLQKLAREKKDGIYDLTRGTQIEAEDGIRNIAAAEEHVMSVMSQTDYDLTDLLRPGDQIEE